MRIVGHCHDFVLSKTHVKNTCMATYGQKDTAIRQQNATHQSLLYYVHHTKAKSATVKTWYMGMIWYDHPFHNGHPNIMSIYIYISLWIHDNLPISAIYQFFFYQISTAAHVEANTQEVKHRTKRAMVSVTNSQMTRWSIPILGT